jgi:uncharacterized tellurite resistance protein B-like protein
MKFSDILNHFKQGKSTARSHMKNLVEMAAVDGNFSSVEFSLLRTIARRNGISDSQLEEIRKNPSNVAFEVPKDEKIRFEQLFDLVHMMAVDESIHQEERKLSHLFAIKFGYQREIAAELVETVYQNIINHQNLEETRMRVRMLLR